MHSGDPGSSAVQRGEADIWLAAPLSPVAGTVGSPSELWWCDLTTVPDCTASKPGFETLSQRLCKLLILP